MGFFDKIIAAIKMFGTPEVLLLLALVALFVVYGRNIRRVGTRGMVLIGVFCALAGALGAAMRAIPGVQPTSFLVMMAGVLLGPGAGLAAGAVSALLFDFLSVVSIYTPWRMMLWGLMGLGAACGCWPYTALYGALYSAGFQIWCILWTAFCRLRGRP